MILSLTIVIVVYGGMTWIMVTRIPFDDLVGDTHPVYLLADRVGGYALGLGSAVLGIMTMAAMANAGLWPARVFR